jgi:hypothetical protein
MKESQTKATTICATTIFIIRTWVIINIAQLAFGNNMVIGVYGWLQERKKITKFLLLNYCSQKKTRQTRGV